MIWRAEPRRRIGRYGALVDVRRMRVLRTIELKGAFSFDALSPAASRLYLIQYTHASSGDVTDYTVRGYDLRTNRLMPGKIADRREHEPAHWRARPAYASGCKPARRVLPLVHAGV